MFFRSLNGDGDQRRLGNPWIPDDAGLREDSWMIGSLMMTANFAEIAQGP